MILSCNDGVFVVQLLCIIVRFWADGLQTLSEDTILFFKGLHKQNKAEIRGADDDLLLVPESAEEDVFTASLHNLSPEDIELSKASHSKKKKKSGGALARRAVLVICTIV